METIINNLPEYKANQVLTETSLNATSDFLQQQERLSRFGLTQTGIVENLDYRLDQSTIIINEGFGVSTDGYFMAHNYKKGRKVYTSAKTYEFTTTPEETKILLNELKNKPFSSTLEDEQTAFPEVAFYELFTAEEAQLQTDVIEINKFSSGSYKIVLFLEILTKNKDQCSPTSCDSGGNMKEYRVVPLLVLDSKDLYFPLLNCEKELKNQVRIKRFSNLYQTVKSYTDLSQKDRLAKPFYKTILNEYSRLNIQNTKTLSDKIDEMSKWKVPLSLGDLFKVMNLESLKNAKKTLDTMGLQYIPKVYKQDYPYNYGYVAQIDPKSLIPKATGRFLKNTKLPRNFSLKSVQTGVNTQATVYYQYYMDFCNDLQAAINECVNAYNEYVSRNYSSYEKRVQRFLVLGRNDKYNYDQYRYYAIQNFANHSYRIDKEMLFKYFNRIAVLIKKFRTGFLQIRYKKEVRFVPSRAGHCLLEERAIPFYYQQDLELENAWIVSKKKSLQAEIYQYRNLNDPYSHFVYAINDYDFIRVEGDMNAQLTQNVAGAQSYASVDKKIRLFNIPINYSVINIDQFDNFDDLRFWEHTGGTKTGGKFIFVMANVKGQQKIIADFQMCKLS